jgi:hypothetical protein
MGHSLSGLQGKYFGLTTGGAAAAGFGSLVAPSGGDYTTWQAAINDNLKYFEVKGGETYTENLTFDETCQTVLVHPGATLSGTITVSNDDVTIELGPMCTVTGQINWNGANGRIKCDNGCNFDSQLILSSTAADSFTLDGGGWDTLFEDRLHIQDGNGIYKDFSSNTKTGATGRESIQIDDNGDNCILNFINIINSDTQAITASSGNSDNIWSMVTVQQTDNRSVEAEGPRKIVCGFSIINPVSVSGIDSDGNGDDSVWNANIVNDTLTNAAGDNDQCIYGNRIDTTLTDNDGTGTVAANDTTAF